MCRVTLHVVSVLICDVVFVWRQVGGVLEGNGARFTRTLEAGLRLQKAGCGGVGVATGELEARWRSLRKRLDSERTSLDRERTLRSR